VNIRRKRGRPSNAERTARALAAMAPDPPPIPVEPPDQIIALAEPERELFLHVEVPPSWTKGQLLNVRNAGEHYVITLLGEEFDPRHPERAVKFSNPALCQDWISRWYQREHFDPRAG